eukprot:5327349-Pyramimonas_sp.AAC.1
MDAFAMEELTDVLNKMSVGKVAGVDDIPPEFWKYLLLNGEALDNLLVLCQKCWDQNDIPTQWKTSC